MRGQKREARLRARDPRIHLQEMMDCRVKPGNDDIPDNSPDIRADIHRHQRYINPARHRPGFWRSDGNHK
jgi:hypothetical protein